MRCDVTVHCDDGSDEQDCDAPCHQNQVCHLDLSFFFFFFFFWPLCIIVKSAISTSLCPLETEYSIFLDNFDGGKMFSVRVPYSGQNFFLSRHIFRPKTLYYTVPIASQMRDSGSASMKNVSSYTRTLLVAVFLFFWFEINKKHSRHSIRSIQSRNRFLSNVLLNLTLQVQCANHSLLWYWHNSCLNQNQICDYYVDCQDQSDELKCNHQYKAGSRESKSPCPSNYFPCGYLNSTWGPLCLPQNKRCNGQRDCLNGADEEGCDTLCPPHRTPCLNGTGISTGLGCVLFESRCDEVIDCSDGSDELSCVTSLISIT